MYEYKKKGTSNRRSKQTHTHTHTYGKAESIDGSLAFTATFDRPTQVDTDNSILVAVLALTTTNDDTCIRQSEYIRCALQEFLHLHISASVLKSSQMACVELISGITFIDEKAARATASTKASARTSARTLSASVSALVSASSTVNADSSARRRMYPCLLRANDVRISSHYPDISGCYYNTITSETKAVSSVYVDVTVQYTSTNTNTSSTSSTSSTNTISTTNSSSSSSSSKSVDNSKHGRFTKQNHPVDKNQSLLYYHYLYTHHNPISVTSSRSIKECVEYTMSIL